MNEGILEVKLLPAWTPSSVKPEIVAALSKSELLQAGIGYWTVKDALFGPHLPRVLRGKNGFACVDLHPPTEVDALASLATQGSHLYVYYEDIPTYTDQGRKEPPCLLHAKMLLFWSKDRTAELWIGSHNWTNRAILGLNVEASLIVRLQDSCSLFVAAAEYLEKMKSISEPFDLSKVDFYKETQRKMGQGLTPVIELEAQDAGTVDDSTVTVFGTDTAELNGLGTVQKDVNVALFDANTDEQYLYPATIVHTGLLSTSNSAAGGLSFSSRRHAFRRGQTFALLLPYGPVDASVLGTAEYFVTLKLGRLNTTHVAEYPPPRTVALEEINDEVSPLLRRLDADAKNLLFRGKRPRVRRPVIVAEEARARTVAERRSLPEHPLVSMRVLLPKNP